MRIFGIQTNPHPLVHIGVSAHPGAYSSNPGPKARSIPAWGNAPGSRQSYGNTRAVSQPYKRLWSGPTALVHLIIPSLGRCPRLVWNAPSALMIALRRNPNPSGIRAALPVMLFIDRDSYKERGRPPHSKNIGGSHDFVEHRRAGAI